MRYEVSFGSISRAPRAASAGAKFRLALLGDFSGRANAGRLETGAALAARKPIKVDVDNIDQVIERMQLSLALPLAEDDRAVVVSDQKSRRFPSRSARRECGAVRAVA